MAKVTFTKGKKPRNELRLPPLHYIVADDWIKKLGEKAFCAWLKFHTWVDRTDEDREFDRVPYTLEKVAKKLGMSRTTLYRTIITPLWEYGLIDLIEYDDPKKKGQKSVNIIVYESPMNLHETKVMPLVKLRDYKKDYGSTAQIYGLKGGRPKTKKDEAPSEEGAKTPSKEGTDAPPSKDGEDIPDRFKNETVGEDDPNRFKNETVPVSKMKRNNDSNIITNSSNHHQGKGIDDDGSAEVKKPWESDFQYMAFRQQFVSAGGADIKKHKEHYQKFLDAKNKVGFGRLCELADEYIRQVQTGENDHETPQIVWFLSESWQTFQNLLRKKEAQKPKNSKNGKAQVPNHPVPDAQKTREYLKKLAR